MSLFNLTVLDPGSMMAQYLLTFGVFPVVVWCFMRWQQVFLAYEA
jgi:hypothetical protein